MGLSKTDFMRGMQCPKQLWLDAHKPELKVIPEKTQLRLDRGNDFGDRARAMFGPFVEVTEYIPNTKYLDKRKMVQNTISASFQRRTPPMTTICRRLHRGDDLLLSIKAICAEYHIAAGVVLSGVGCLTRAVLRDADGVTVRTVDEHCEILSLMGTVSQERCHLHIALSRQGLSAFGGHLKEGCLVNTTCELVLGVLDGWRYGQEQDAETGYDEITFERD